HIGSSACLLKIMVGQVVHKKLRVLCGHLARLLAPPFRDRRHLLMDIEQRSDLENEPVILQLAVRHPRLERVQETKRNRRPKILDTDEVEEDEPTLHRPHATSQLANEVGFSITGWADDQAAQRLIDRVRFERLPREIIDKVA